MRQSNDLVGQSFAKYLWSNKGQNVSLTTDRNFYMAGEKIWFRVYVTHSGNGTLDVTSHNLFADLVTGSDSVVQQLVLDNKSLRTAGAFQIPTGLSTGIYWIRAYTAKQLVGDTLGIFLRPVYILNKQLQDESDYRTKFLASVDKSRQSQVLIDFFPERLSPDSEFTSTGVIRIVDGLGNPASISGNLLDANDSLVRTFSTNSLGMAPLAFVNNSTRNHRIEFQFNGQIHSYKLPAKADMQLAVAAQTDQSLNIMVTLEKSMPSDTRFAILAVQRDSLCYAATGAGNYGIAVPINKFPAGIVKLLLFDNHKNLVDERQIFIPGTNAALQITADQAQHGKREKVGLEVTVSNRSGKPVPAFLNVSVQSAELQQLSDTIAQTQLPLSDQVNLDGWLAEHQNKYSADDIDMLMIASGAKAGSSVKNEPGITKYDDNSKLLNLQGKIIKRRDLGQPNSIVTAISKNTNDFFIDFDTTGSKGDFSLSIPQGFDSLQLSVHARDLYNVPIPKDKMIIDSFQFPVFSTPQVLKDQFLGNNIKTLQLVHRFHPENLPVLRGGYWLPPVVVRAKKEEKFSYDVTKRLSSFSKIVTSDQIKNDYGSLAYSLLKIPGVNISNGTFVIWGGPFAALVIENGVPIADTSATVEYVNSLQPGDIDFIEVLRGGEAGIYGMRGAGGVISINTKNGKTYGPDNSNNTLVIKPVTYHVAPKFPMPDYANAEMKNDSSPDDRTTMLWNGNLATGPEGKVDLSFYTGDQAGQYTITVSGLTNDGERVFQQESFTTAGNN